MNFKMRQRAFSLVELMVVVSIIAVVAGVGLVSVSRIQRSSRDTQRQSDLRAIQSALQQYYANEQHYPDSMALNGNAPLNNCTGLTGCTPIRTYMQRTPTDPVAGTGDPYCYTATRSVTNTATCSGGTAGTCHYYELCARLENSSAAGGICTCDAQNNFEVNPL